VREIGAGLSHDVRTPDVETASDAYAARFAGPVGAWMLEVQARHALALVSAAAPGPLSVLEVGGGHGQLTGHWLAAGHEVVVHGSRGVCHARLRAGAARVAHVTSDPWALPFADRSFDLVVALRLLAHVEAWRELLAELCRVAGGLVLVDFPARGALQRLAPALFGAKRRLEGNTRPYFAYAPGEVGKALARSGFEVAGAARQFAWPMALHRLLGAPALSRQMEALAARIGSTTRWGSPILCLARRVADPGPEGIPRGASGAPIRNRGHNAPVQGRAEPVQAPKGDR
jgi:SAM-dependent methyltransferase